MFCFAALAVAFVSSVLGPNGAFPGWILMLLLSSVNGCLFYGLFNSTYPFSFFLQMQVYSVATVAGLAAYTPVAFVTSCLPAGGFTSFGAWLVLHFFL